MGRSLWWEKIATDWATEQQETAQKEAHQRAAAKAWLDSAAQECSPRERCNDQQTVARLAAKEWVASIGRRDDSLRAEVGSSLSQSRKIQQKWNSNSKEAFREEAVRNELNVACWESVDTKPLGLTLAFRTSEGKGWPVVVRQTGPESLSPKTSWPEVRLCAMTEACQFGTDPSNHAAGFKTTHPHGFVPSLEERRSSFNASSAKEPWRLRNCGPAIAGGMSAVRSGLQLHRIGNDRVTEDMSARDVKQLLASNLRARRSKDSQRNHSCRWPVYLSFGEEGFDAVFAESNERWPIGISVGNALHGCYPAVVTSVNRNGLAATRQRIVKDLAIVAVNGEYSYERSPDEVRSMIEKAEKWQQSYNRCSTTDEAEPSLLKTQLCPPRLTITFGRCKKSFPWTSADHVSSADSYHDMLKLSEQAVASLRSACANEHRTRADALKAMYGKSVVLLFDTAHTPVEGLPETLAAAYFRRYGDQRPAAEDIGDW
eukprot:SAG31_NODE_2777_length_5104_cov_3.012587_3_plen_486_part_00